MDSRAESWGFIVGGGAGFSQINGAFTVENPAGRTTQNEQLLTGFANLKAFMSGFTFDKIHLDHSTLLSLLENGVFYRLLSESRKQYAFYMHHSIKQTDGYQAVAGRYQKTMRLCRFLLANTKFNGWTQLQGGLSVQKM